MFSISICTGSVVWSLLFRTKEAAEAAHGILNGPLTSRIVVADDFGQVFTSDPSLIVGILFEDLNQSKLAHQERMLHTARTNAGAQKAAQSDPQLRSAMQPSSPAIVSPFSGMPR